MGFVFKNISSQPRRIFNKQLHSKTGCTPFALGKQAHIVTIIITNYLLFSIIDFRLSMCWQFIIRIFLLKILFFYSLALIDILVQLKFPEFFFFYRFRFVSAQDTVNKHTSEKDSFSLFIPHVRKKNNRKKRIMT